MPQPPKPPPKLSKADPIFSMQNNKIVMELEGKKFIFRNEAQISSFVSDLSYNYQQDTQKIQAEIESLKRLLSALRVSVNELKPPPQKILNQIKELDYHIQYTESYLVRAQYFASTLTSTSLGLLNNLATELVNRPKMLAGFDRNRYLIDDIRDYSKGVSAASKHGLKYYHDRIVDEILKGKMQLGGKLGGDELKAITKNIYATKDPQHLLQALEVLSLLADAGVQGHNALEMLRGGHFIVEGDKGELFEKLKALQGAEQRFSSHFADTRIEEYGINCGRIIPEILFLTTFDPNDPTKKAENSHFQMESSPWRPELKKIAQNPQNLEHIPHSATYFVQKLAAERKGNQVRNLGPYGWSPNNDANPIRLGADKLRHIPGKP